jgi:hypothetical protein
MRLALATTLHTLRSHEIHQRLFIRDLAIAELMK